MLDNENVSLDEVLGEDTLIQEVKGTNPKVLQFLAKEEIISKLLDYLTMNPSKDVLSQDDYELALFKYPYIVCEIFCCDIPQINLVVANHPNLIAKFFDYLKNNTEEASNLNPARSGYVLRAFGSLFDENYAIFADHLFKLDAQFSEGKQDAFLDLILNQIHLPDMDNLLLRILGFSVENTFEDFGLALYGGRQFRDYFTAEQDNSASDEKKLQVKNWAVEKRWIEKIVDFLAQHPHDEFVHMNLFNVMATSIEKGDNPISLKIMSDDVISLLVTILLKNANTPLFAHGVEFLLKVIDQNDVHYESDPEEQKAPGPISCISERTEEFVALLSSQTLIESLTAIETPSEVINVPLGEARLAALQLLRRLFRLKYVDVQDILVKSKAFNVIVDLFFTYNHNNIMHSNGYTVIFSVLHEFPQSEDMIHESGLLEKLIGAYKDSLQREKNGQSTSSIMGHVVSIVNQVNSVINHNAILADHAQKIKGWDKFVRSYISQRNEITNIDLGGPRLNSSYSYDHFETFSDSSSDEEEEIASPQKESIEEDASKELNQDASSTSSGIAAEESQPKDDQGDSNSQEDETEKKNTADMVAGGFDDDDDFDADFESA